VTPEYHDLRNLEQPAATDPESLRGDKQQPGFAGAWLTRSIDVRVSD
jgi:hypothetical protein